ncbi:FtsX-like permease family protein [Actinoplanes sp. Pm04-4]|uniref:FtsX-like permease family protein n=1 Tax=Paractinoplanes pyxinae TaxID=2997416 RepID=A0ABT4B1A1_9ACTN|nr:FtsX-like permease family protein [Actinoplanes pyxinae]MCY1140274.1 FtsX-like permease family protein [Actinoplanes pyxinae]
MLRRDRLGSFIAVLVGATVVTLTLTLLASAVPQRPDRFAAVTVAVQNPDVTTPADPFPESRPWSTAEATALATRLAAVLGVEAAVADRSFYAQPVIGGRPVAEIQQGHGWASAVLASDRLIAGRPAATGHEVVLGAGAGIPVGGSVTVLTATGPATWEVTGLIDAARLYVADTEAARLAPGVRVIGLTGEPNPEAVRAVADGATVLHGDGLGRLEPRSDARDRWIGLQVLTAMVALSVFSSAFVIASTLALSVNQRRREIGLLRAVGATPRQVRLIVLREAGVTGLWGGASGAVLGLLLAPLVAGVLVDAGFQPESFRVGVRIWPVLAGVVMGPLVAVAGGLLAARRAAHVHPIEALRRAEVETRPMTRARWVVGLVFAAGGVAAGAATVVTDDLSALGTYALLGAMALIVSAAVLAPAVVPLVVGLILRPAGGALGTVIRESALAGSRRTASTAAPVLLTVAFSVFIAGNVQTAEKAYAERRAEATATREVIVPDGTPGLSDAAAPTGELRTSVYIGKTVMTAAGSPSGPDDGSVVLGESRAREFGVAEGAVITVTFADGARVPLRVSAVEPDRSASTGMQLAREVVRRHDPSALAPAMPLPAETTAAGKAAARPSAAETAEAQPSAPGTAAARPTAAGTAAARPSAPGTAAARSSVAASVGGRVVDVATYAREADAEEDRQVWIFTLLLIGISVGYGALAVANTLAMATARRANDYRLLRLAGATRRQVLLAVAGESALAVVVGSVLGIAAAVFALRGATAGFRAQTGTSVGLTVPWPVLIAAVGTCFVLAVIAATLPARAHLNAANPLRERA